MHKILVCVIGLMCIFVLTHHLPTISASASDLSSAKISSSSLPSSLSATTSSLATTMVDIANSQSVDTATKKSITIDTSEGGEPRKEILIPASSTSLSLSSSSSFPATEVATTAGNLATHRQTRSLLYPYSGGNFYISYGTGDYYYPSLYYCAFYPTVYNPYYRYPHVIFG